MKYCLISFLPILLVKCQDPDKQIPVPSKYIGKPESAWKIGIEDMVENKILTQKVDDEEIYRYYFSVGEDSIYSDVHFNPDGYNFGILRSLKFDLRKEGYYEFYNDTIYTRTSYPREKNKVNRLLAKFIELYGPPSDTLGTLYDEKEKSNLITKSEIYDKASVSKFNPREIVFLNRFSNTTHLKETSIIWDFEDLEILFHPGDRLGYFDLELNKRSNPDFNSDSVYVNPYILYRIKEYSSRIISIADSISKILNPTDIIGMRLVKPSWRTTSRGYFNNEKIILRIDNVHVKSKEITRTVKAIKFDILFKSLFEDNLYTVSDLELFFDSPIEYPADGLMKSNGFTWTKEYNSENPDYQILQRLRNMKSDQYEIDYFIKSLVFDDGTILNF